jgi:hypothetical protein
MTGQYTPKALNGIMENPTVSRYEAAKISGTVVAAGAIHNVNLTRLWTQDEITKVRQKAAELRGSYRPPGG